MYELLNKISGNGLCVSYKFSRTISVFSPKMVSIELTFTNNKDDDVSNIKIGEKVSHFSYLLVPYIFLCHYFRHLKFNLIILIQEL